MLGDADHLTLDSFQHAFGQYDVVAGDAWPWMEAERPGALTELVVLEGDHLAAEDVVLADKFRQGTEQPGGGLPGRRQNLYLHRQAPVLRSRRAQQHDVPVFSLETEEEAESDAVHLLVYRDRQALEVHRPDAVATPMPGDLEQLGQRVVSVVRAG